MPVPKKEIISLLEKKAFDELSVLSMSDGKVISRLISLSYDKDKTLSWRAMEAIGLATRQMAGSNPEHVRNIAGRLLWMMRDESGGMAWSAPDILGEIVRNNPVLCVDLAPIVASFHDEKMLCSGVLRAIGRMGRINRETTEHAIPIIRSYLGSVNSTLRGLAAFALGELGSSIHSDDLDGLKDDKSMINFYEDGELRQRTVGELAASALKRLTEH